MTTKRTICASRKDSFARPLRVGIPRAMGYYEHGPFWVHFFELLHCKVILSPPTNQEIMNLGVRAATSELCLPMKVLVGHACALEGKVDAIFVPRYLSFAAGEMCCPKSCALPDIIRFALGGKTKILEADVDPDRFSDNEHALLFTSISKQMNLSEEKLRTTFFRAQELFEAAEENQFIKGTKKTLATLGHPYVLEDPRISMEVAQKLHAHGFDVIMPKDLSHRSKRADVHPYDGKPFYAVGLDVLGSAHYLLKKENICGIIYLTPFGCGIDALTAAHVEEHLHQAERALPFMKLTVDEQTGEAGFDTRLEAFLDMIGE